jgi:hypothetical protein
VKKGKFYKSFVARNKKAMEVLSKFGLLGRGAWGKLGGKRRTFSNIAEHCLTVGMVADAIFSRLHEVGYLSKKLWWQGTLAAILHDATKRWELEVMFGIEAGVGLGYYPRPTRCKEIAKILFDRMAITPDVRCLFYLAGLSGGGANSITREQVKPLRSKRDMIRWTIFLADYMVTNTDIVSPFKRWNEIMNREGIVDKETIRKYKKKIGKEPDPSLSTREIFQITSPNLEFMFTKVETDLKSAMEIDISILNFVLNALKKQNAL